MRGKICQMGGKTFFFCSTFAFSLAVLIIYVVHDGHLTLDVVARESRSDVRPVELQFYHAAVLVGCDAVPATKVFRVFDPPVPALPRLPARCPVKVKQHIAVRQRRGLCSGAGGFGSLTSKCCPHANR